MVDRLSNDQEPEVFERLQRLAIHERRRRWDSTRNALTATSNESEKAQAVLPTDLVSERFEWLECQMAALARELRRVESRSKRQTMRAQVAIASGLIMAVTGIGLVLGEGVLHAWFWHVSG